MDTRAESYYDLMDTDYISVKQREVYNYIKEHPDVTYNQVCRALMLAHNTTTARIKELRDLGLIITTGYSVDPFTHKRNSTYRVRTNTEPMDKHKRNYLTLPRVVKNEIIAMLDDEDCTKSIEIDSDGKPIKRKSYNYSDSTGDYEVYTCGNSLITLKCAGMYVFNDMGMYCEDSAQRLFTISTADSHFTFRIR